MLKSYLKIAWRNLIRSKLYSSINLAGLSVGMAVAILIGLWIYDEVSYNRNFSNYDRIGQLWQFVSFTKEKSSYTVIPLPVGDELRAKYPDFKYVASTSDDLHVTLGIGDKKITQIGRYAEPDMAEMLSLHMLSGDRRALKDMHSMLISATLARALFGNEDPMGKTLSLDNSITANVAGVYEDLPLNSNFADLSFLAPWDLYASSADYIRNARTEWDNNSWPMYAQLKEGADFKNVSDKIRDIRMKQNDPPKYKPEFFIYPMKRWHLYSDFTNGVNTGGLIQFVWLFGTIGVFVLLLACINFMNLSTARSERRAREVGIRKAIGSVRKWLVFQFYSESLLMALLAFGFAIFLVAASLPWFNIVAGKELHMPWVNPFFWILGLGFTLLTGLIAGSYPALYLSSFKPIKVLKGTFKAGRLSAMPRRILVILQFSVSVMLIIGTMVVYRQIRFARDLPVGYNRNGLIQINMSTPEIYKHYNALRTELLSSGAVAGIAASNCALTVQTAGTTDISWKGKVPNSRPLVMVNNITHEFGSTVGWQLLQGRDFSRAFGADSSKLLLNEAAVKLMGFRNPLGEMVRHKGKEYTVIGIVKNMIREDPFRPVKPAFYRLAKTEVNTIVIGLAPQKDRHTALASIGSLFHKYNPASPFDYSWVDKEYGKKFQLEERIGSLAACFAGLAILISCLGLFGLASFVAEQRTREIGVRKILGASIFTIWQLLSKEFIALVTISMLIAIPVAWHYMNDWLQNYTYHTQMTWWIAAIAALGAIAITLLTVSFQAIKAAMTNPVKALRSE